MVFRKWDGSLHWHFSMEHLGEDEHGIWLGAPPLTPLRRGAEPPIVQQHAFALLAPASGSWVACWNAAGRVEIYVDVTSAPVWDDGTLTTVDVDLDVVRYRDGTTALLDEDEFADHQVRLAYPPDVVETAERTAKWLMEVVAARVEPFDTVGPGWLDAV